MAGGVTWQQDPHPWSCYPPFEVWLLKVARAGGMVSYCLNEECTMLVPVTAADIECGRRSGILSKFSVHWIVVVGKVSCVKIIPFLDIALASGG